jgi:hypothetical protein
MKKYSETFINSTNILKNARVGFEFELYMKDLSYYKTLEILNQYLEPVRVHGFRKYHSDFKPDADNFKIEPDLSLGSNGMEIITGPLEYFSAKHYLVKILKFMQEYGYTNEKCAIHFNISFNEDCEKNLNNLNVLKLVLSTDEDEIYSYYPTRKDNVYAKTVKKVIPFKEYDYNNVGIETIKNTLRLPDDKYYGINFLHINDPKESQRLEYRYIGGKDYEKNIGQIIYFLDKFILDVWNSVSANFTDADISELEKYLRWNISNFKNLAKYDNFIVDFPSISLQIDQNYGYHIVNAYYSKIFDKLFVLVDSTDSLKDCIINYVTAFQTMEVIDARIKSTQNIKDFEFINCVVSDGIFDNCTFVNCEIENCQIVKSKINGSRVKKTKILNCSVEASEVMDCFFMNGFLNCDMIGGVFRSGKLGPYANISSETKVVTDHDNFFDTSFDDDNYDFKTDKGVIKAFKK